MYLLTYLICTCSSSRNRDLSARPPLFIKFIYHVRPRAAIRDYFYEKLTNRLNWLHITVKPSNRQPQSPLMPLYNNMVNCKLDKSFLYIRFDNEDN